MTADATPNFFVVLNLLVHAFHLDNEEPDLRGSGRFQHHLSARRIDIKEEGALELLRCFGAALLRSGVFPVIDETLRCDTVEARDDDVARYLGSAMALPTCSGNRESDAAARLAWLAEQHEEFLSKARSQDLGTDTDPAFALLPVMRFGWHHVTFAIATLFWCGGLDDACLGAMAPEMTWWMEKPSSTPMQDACVAAGLSRRQVLSDLSRSDPDRARGWNEKTIDNLWNGGPDHPTLDSLEMVTELLFPADATTLARWRRWYGLRDLARRFAGLWGWKWLDGCLATTLAHARIFAHDLRRSALRPDQAKVVASVVLWTGWRSQLARFAFGSASRLAGDDPHPTLRLDYRAIGASDERLRLDDCVALVKGTGSFELEIRTRGRDPEAARRDALHIVWLLQGDLGNLAHLDPIPALLGARHRQDWRAAEEAARALVQMRPQYVDNHYRLVEALAHQDRFDDALSVVRTAQTRFPWDPSLAQAEVLTLMLRGEHRRDHTDFEAARERLLARNPAGTEWEAHLLLADCHLALGDWKAAREACQLVTKHNPQCGEARAIVSICCAKLGERQSGNKAAEHAAHRGERALVEELRRRDDAGELGRGPILPVPRWHRLSVQPEPAAARWSDERMRGSEDHS